MVNQKRDPITGLPPELGDDTFRANWGRFYENVLSISPIAPATDLRRLCQEWRATLKAAWVWLWVFHHGTNGHSSRWELTALDSNGAIEDCLPANLTLEGCRDCLVEYANKLGRPVFVSEVANWQRSLDGETYRVVAALDLLKKGCDSFVCVPLLPPSGSAESMGRFRLPIRAAICCHFTERPAALMQGGWPLEWPREWPLMLMGIASANFISNSYESAQHEIFAKMAFISAKYLAVRTGRKPESDRLEYLHELIALTKEHLSASHVSIFYRDQTHENLVCIASTGLFDATTARIPPTELAKARYAKREGLTGGVFATGEPFLSQIGESAPRARSRFQETPPGKASEQEVAWVIYPILAPNLPSAAGGQPQVLGVVRCVGNQAVFAQDRKRNYDPIQLRTLDFICRLLAPVLETMAANIEREKTVSIVKHELFAPLEMMDDTIREAADAVAENRLLPQYFVPDLQFSIATAKHLVAELDRAPTRSAKLDAVPTGLEGDIIAGITSMMRHYAMKANKMEIWFGDVHKVIPHLRLDRNLISRAFYNLIVNAVKYGDAGSVIRVEPRADIKGSYYYLDIINTGIGITPEEARRVFEEGYRSPRAANRAIGVGMGLKIAKAIMEQHGGQLQLKSLDAPTVFSMAFPARLRCHEPVAT